MHPPGLCVHEKAIALDRHVVGATRRRARGKGAEREARRKGPLLASRPSQTPAPLDGTGTRLSCICSPGIRFSPAGGEPATEQRAGDGRPRELLERVAADAVPQQDAGGTPHQRQDLRDRAYAEPAVQGAEEGRRPASAHQQKRARRSDHLLPPHARLITMITSRQGQGRDGKLQEKRSMWEEEG